MKESHASFASAIGPGVAAGLAGTCVMMAMRTFDQRFAPKTIPQVKEDPGIFLVRAAERATGTRGDVPASVEQPAAMAAHTGYGTLFGLIYGLSRGRGHHRSALADGLLLGAAVYVAGYLGWLPLFGITGPVWKQKFPAVAGEWLRHVAYGVATCATYGVIDDLL